MASWKVQAKRALKHGQRPVVVYFTKVTIRKPNTMTLIPINGGRKFPQSSLWLFNGSMPRQKTKLSPLNVDCWHGRLCHLSRRRGCTLRPHRDVSHRTCSCIHLRCWCSLWASRLSLATHSAHDTFWLPYFHSQVARRPNCLFYFYPDVVRFSELARFYLVTSLLVLNAGDIVVLSDAHGVSVSVRFQVRPGP